MDPRSGEIIKSDIIMSSGRKLRKFRKLGLLKGLLFFIVAAFQFLKKHLEDMV